MPELHMEVGCLGTWGLDLPNPSRTNTLKACPTHIPSHEPHPPHPALAQAPVTLNQEFSGEIRMTIIIIIIIIKIIIIIIIRGEEGGEKTLEL